MYNIAFYNLLFTEIYMELQCDLFKLSHVPCWRTKLYKGH